MGPREGLPEHVAAVRARVVPVAVLPGVDARRVEAVLALEEPGVELAQVLEAHAALVVVSLGWLGRGLRSQSLLLLVVGGEGGEGRPRGCPHVRRPGGLVLAPLCRGRRAAPPPPCVGRTRGCGPGRGPGPVSLPLCRALVWRGRG